MKIRELAEKIKEDRWKVAQNLRYLLGRIEQTERLDHLEIATERFEDYLTHNVLPKVRRINEDTNELIKRVQEDPADYAAGIHGKIAKDCLPEV